MNYTKGEWHTLTYTSRTGMTQHNKALIVCKIQDSQIITIAELQPCDQSNANLISASPDMYEALRHTDIVLANMESAGNILNQQQNLLKIEIKKALAKAEGKGLSEVKKWKKT